MVVTSLSYFYAPLMEAGKYDARFPLAVTRDFAGERLKSGRKLPHSKISGGRG